MRDIDDAGHAEYQRQTGSDKEQARGGGEPVERLKQKCAESHESRTSPRGRGERLTKDVTNENLVRFDGAQLFDLGIAGQNGGTIDIFEIHHRAFAALERDLADVATHRRLVIARPIDEGPEWTVDMQALECLDQLFGIGRLRLGDTGGQRLHGHVADNRAEPRIVVIFLLVGVDEGDMLLGLDLVPRIAGDDPADRRLVLERVEIFRLAGEQADHRAILEYAARIALADELGEVAA